MFLVDLAVPRDIEQEVAELEDIFLYTIDDLSQLVAENLDARRSALQQAEAIIDTQVGQFMHWMDARGSVPLILRLREQAEQSRRHELERALKRLQQGEAPVQVVEALSQGLTNKLIHAPTQALRDSVGEERRALASILGRLFGIK
jgi:glutamyl-tRNA reductase